MSGTSQPSRITALIQLVLMYLAVQALGYIVLRTSFSPYGLNDLWLHGALGPLAAYEVIPRLRYHSLLGNLGFALLCVAVLLMPFVQVVWPRRLTLIVSLIGLIIWWLFGLGFTINHI